MIVILGAEGDEHACHVRDAVRERGDEVELLDSRWFPERVQVAWEFGRDGVAGGELVFPSGRRVGWGEIRSVYWRTYEGVFPPTQPEGEAEVAYHDSRSLFESFLQLCPTRWVNGWEAFDLHQCKPLALAKICGLDLPAKLRVPRTLVGNVPGRAKRFVSGNAGGEMVFKPVQGGAHTRRVTAEHVADENLERLSLSPVTLQEEIAGTDVRVFVAGDKVMACEVRSGHLDFRDDANPEIVPAEIPAEVAEACRVIARTLALRWAGIDLRRTPDGEYVYFEANPSPMFIGFESRCGLPLTEALVDVLVG